MCKTGIALTFGAIFLSIGAGTSHAAAPKAPEPLSQARESVDKNLQKNPDNKGLQNADERLKANQERHEKKRAEQNAKRKTRQAVNKEKHGKPAEMAPEHEKPGHVEKREHPTNPLRRDR